MLFTIAFSTIMWKTKRTFIICGFLLIFNGMKSLKLIQLKVPPHVLFGTQPTMTCQWELGPSESLYSIKWYKDGKEFFRHVPRDSEPQRKFNLPGVKVEKSDPLGSNLTLGPVTIESSGRYRCEVSGERPLFPTVSEHEDMLVVVLPEYGPVISGFRPYYKIGDLVQANCTSGQSRPAVRLTWYINGEPAPISAVVVFDVVKESEGFETTSLGLDFRVTKQHFQNCVFKVKCLATLASIYWSSDEESAREIQTSAYETMEVKSSNIAKLSPSSGQTRHRFSIFVIFCSHLTYHYNISV